MFLFFVLFLRTHTARYKYEGVSKQNRKSKKKIEMKKNRALLGASFKHVSVRFFVPRKSTISKLLPK